MFIFHHSAPEPGLSEVVLRFHGWPLERPRQLLRSMVLPQLGWPGHSFFPCGLSTVLLDLSSGGLRDSKSTCPKKTAQRCNYREARLRFSVRSTKSAPDREQKVRTHTHTHAHALIYGTMYHLRTLLCASKVCLFSSLFLQFS